MARTLDDPHVLFLDDGFMEVFSLMKPGGDEWMQKNLVGFMTSALKRVIALQFINGAVVLRDVMVKIMQREDVEQAVQEMSANLRHDEDDELRKFFVAARKAENDLVRPKINVFEGLIKEEPYLFKAYDHAVNFMRQLIVTQTQINTNLSAAMTKTATTRGYPFFTRMVDTTVAQLVATQQPFPRLLKCVIEGVKAKMNDWKLEFINTILIAQKSVNCAELTNEHIVNRKKQLQKLDERFETLLRRDMLAKRSQVVSLIKKYKARGRQPPEFLFQPFRRKFITESQQKVTPQEKVTPQKRKLEAILPVEAAAAETQQKVTPQKQAEAAEYRKKITAQKRKLEADQKAVNDHDERHAAFMQQCKEQRMKSNSLLKFMAERYGEIATASGEVLNERQTRQAVKTAEFRIKESFNLHRNLIKSREQKLADKRKVEADEKVEVKAAEPKKPLPIRLEIQTTEGVFQQGRGSKALVLANQKRDLKASAFYPVNYQTAQVDGVLDRLLFKEHDDVQTYFMEWYALRALLRHSETEIRKRSLGDATFVDECTMVNTQYPNFEQEFHIFLTDLLKEFTVESNKQVYKPDKSIPDKIDCIGSKYDKLVIDVKEEVHRVLKLVDSFTWDNQLHNFRRKWHQQNSNEFAESTIKMILFMLTFVEKAENQVYVHAKAAEAQKQAEAAEDRKKITAQERKLEADRQAAVVVHDKALLQVAYDSKRVVDLKKLCKARDLPCTGNKPVLVRRLVAFEVKKTFTEAPKEKCLPRDCLPAKAEFEEQNESLEAEREARQNVCMHVVESCKKLRRA
jgi:hypothetical protein